MIVFHCLRCEARYEVTDDKAGLKTTCPRCKLRLIVPDSEPVGTDRPTRRSRRRAWVFVVGLVVLGLFVLGLYQLMPYPPQAEVEKHIRSNLPPGYEKYTFRSYDSRKGDLHFLVSYFEPGSPLPVEYEAFRSYDDLGTFGPRGWTVHVSGRRRFGQPWEKLDLVDAVYDRRGKLIWKRALTNAAPGEAAALEERARGIAQAVNGAF